MKRPIDKKATSKHVPQRTCIACRRVFYKKEVIRLVCTDPGTVEADIGGKKPGRGAYLCRNIECWEEGLKGSRIEHALKTEVSKESKEKLLRWARNFLADSNNIE